MSRYPAVLEYFGINSRGFRAVYLRLRVPSSDAASPTVDSTEVTDLWYESQKKSKLLDGRFFWLSFCVSAHEFPFFFGGWEVCANVRRIN